MRRAFVVIALLGVACTSSDPQKPTTTPTASSEPTAPVTHSPRPLKNRRLAPFDEAVRLDATHVRLTFNAGMDGCGLLDHVEVRVRDGVLSAGLYVGNDVPEGVTGCTSVGVTAYAVAEVPAEPRATSIVDEYRGQPVPIR